MTNPKDHFRRVVITGIGMVTPVGNTAEESWRNVVDGVSGAAEFTIMDHADFPVHFGCEVKNFRPEDWIDAREVKRMDRFVHFALATSHLAVRDAGLDLEALDLDRCGVVYGSGIGGITSIEKQLDNYYQKGPRRISPFSIPLLMINAGSGHIAIQFGFRGPNYAPVTACASGSHALGLALRHIQVGDADVVISGGSEAGIGILGLGGFSNMKALSTRNDNPQKASRPFDKDRDGFVMGEGAGALILEEYEHAKRRGARIYAEFLSCGFTDDGHHITAPSDSGMGCAQAIRIALQDAKVDPAEVDYINAHGTSTPYNDRAETAAVKLAFGEENARKVSISSTKGCTGHLLGAAGGVELGFLAKAVHEGVIPPTINYETPDPDCDLDYTPNVARKREIRYAISNSLGFGGHNASLLIKRFTD